MPSNKARLYVALYPSGVVGNEERRYHWAFLIGPKKEKNDTPGTHFHVRNTPMGSWQYEETRLGNIQSTVNLLARIIIAKVEDENRLIEILRTLPVIQNDPAWRCHTWVASALQAIAADGKAVGTSELSWSKIEVLAREYVAKKLASGRYESGTDVLAAKPTYDLLADEEIVA